MNFEKQVRVINRKSQGGAAEQLLCYRAASVAGAESASCFFFFSFHPDYSPSGRAVVVAHVCLKPQTVIHTQRLFFFFALELRPQEHNHVVWESACF